MRLKTTEIQENKQKEMVTAARWTPSNQLLSCSDAKVIVQWNTEGSGKTKLCDVDAFVTDMSVHSASKTPGASLIAIACSDGSFRILNGNGRVEKTVPAHEGAITAIRWNHEGTAIATAGEDGFLKQWSPNGNIRSKLEQSDRAVYDLCWSPDNQSVLYCSGRNIVIKPLQVSSKPTKWKAHEGTVLKVDWNPVNGLIVSGGEDCRYKVWDAYGRALYVSKPAEYSITAVSWSPGGDLFAVGSFNSLVLCDRAGWPHSRENTSSGSLCAIDWTSDGTNLAAAGANGTLVFGHVIDRTVSWKNFEVSLNQRNQVVVRDVMNEQNFTEELEFGDRVIDISMAYNHLVVVTTRACYIYAVDAFNAPHRFDFSGVVSLIIQAEKCFLLVDNAHGIQLFTYEGKAISNISVKGLRPKYLKQGNIALCNEGVALIDPTTKTQIHMLDLKSGKPLAEPISHTAEIIYVALNQCGLVNERKIVFLDINRDLFIAQIHNTEAVKMASMVDTVMWNDASDIIAAVSDAKLLVWYYPSALFVDKDMVKQTCGSVDATHFGKNPTFVSFVGDTCLIRRTDGALQASAVSPFPAHLYQHTVRGNWHQAARLCRFVKDPTLWACLAVMAFNNQEFETAEIAFSAIDEVDKVEFVQQLMEIPSAEGRTAELALYRRRYQDAENILLQAGLVYRAIRLNIRTFRWERALELALKYKVHLDTVVAYRQKFLNAGDRRETIRSFTKYGNIAVDFAAVQASEQKELEAERARGSAYPSRRKRLTLSDPKTGENMTAAVNQAAQQRVHRQPQQQQQQQQYSQHSENVDFNGAEDQYQ